MAIYRLNPRFVETVKAKGKYADGGGLYLQVGDDGRAKSWIFRYGARQMGLGALHTIGLAEARERARKCREQRNDGIDPIDARKTEREAQRLKAEKQVTFETCVFGGFAGNGDEVDGWIKRNEESWWPSTLYNIKCVCRKHLIPVLGKLPVSATNVDLAEFVLVPIWRTATGLKAAGYLEEILDWATAKDFRQGPNPGSLKGALGLRLSWYSHKSVSHPFIPYQEIGAFMAKLRALPVRGERPSPTAYTPFEAGKAVGRDSSIILDAINAGKIIAIRTKTGFFIEPAELHKVYPPINDMDPKRRCILSYAMDFNILTAVRSHQIFGKRVVPEAGRLKWEEIDWDNKVWNCPAPRTKSKKLHEIALSDDAIAILKTMREHQKEDGINSEYVFVHPRRTKKAGPGHRLLRRQAGRPEIERIPAGENGLQQRSQSWLPPDIQHMG